MDILISASMSTSSISLTKSCSYGVHCPWNGSSGCTLGGCGTYKYQ